VTSTLFNNVRLFDLTSDAGMGDACDLRIAGGRISDTAPTLAPRSGERVINGKGGLIMPGLINAHFHSSVNHMKGRLPSLPLEIFMLYESPELDVLRPTPREAYLRTMLGIFEMLKTGCTSVQDDCFFVPCPTPEIIDAVAQAYLDSGIRVRLALDQPQVSELDKLPFLQDLLPDDLRQELSLAHGPSASELLGMAVAMGG
jgi:5-methylthioadenosine/S-adenosylhomocysteine deaminase